MKHYYLLLLATAISLSLFSQKTVLNPKHGLRTASNVRITKVELTDSSTILSFHVRWMPGGSITVSHKSYIQIKGSEEKLWIVKSTDVEIDQPYIMTSTGVVDYNLYFPAIDTSTTKFDFGEKDGQWFIDDIQLKYEPYQGILPEQMLGTWFASDGSKTFVMALYDTVAVYQSQVWKYGKVIPSEKYCSIELKNNSSNQKLLVQQIDSSNIKMGTTKQNMVELCNYKKEVPGYKLSDDAPYSSPVIKDGMTVYKGFIHNYTTRMGLYTGLIHVKNPITGNRETYSVKVAPDGSFSVSFPMVCPGSVYENLPYSDEPVYLEPGVETFNLIDLKRSKDRNLFMGPLAHLNDDLIEIGSISYFDNNKVLDTILSLSPIQYRDYCNQIRDKELSTLNEYATNHSVSQKALQIIKYGILCTSATNIMEYDWNYEAAYRKKNNISYEQQELDLMIPESDSTVYNFITNDFINDPLAIISNDYYIFTNRIKYLNIIRPEVSFQYSIDNFVKLVKEEGLTLTEEEQELVKNTETIQDTIAGHKWEAFFKKNEKTVSSFFTKYRKTIDSLSADSSFLFWYDMEDRLKKQGILIADNEKELLAEAKTIQTREQLLEGNRINEKSMKTLEILAQKYNYLISPYLAKATSDGRNDLLKRKFGVEKGFASDIMIAQDLCTSIVEEATPMDADRLKIKLQPITTPSIADYVLSQNEKTIKRIEENKLKTGYAVNLTPDVEADKLFDAMMAKFKGKVIYVDFWATWCGPCRSGMERIKPLKEELEGKDIVFVCITNESSPEGTWKNMITDIKGEHFRVKPDEWNTLCNKFNISGIPHYVLVDKNGVVAKNDGMPDYDLSAMKALFEEYMAK